MKQTIKLERLTSKDSNTDESLDIGPSGSNLISGLNPLTQALMKASQMSLPASNDDAWKILEDVSHKILIYFSIDFEFEGNILTYISGS